MGPGVGWREKVREAWGSPGRGQALSAGQAEPPGRPGVGVPGAPVHTQHLRGSPSPDFLSHGDVLLLPLGGRAGCTWIPEVLGT